MRRISFPLILGLLTLLAACCPVPAGQRTLRPGSLLARPGAESRLLVRTDAGPIGENGLPARTEEGDVVWLAPLAGVSLPRDATVYVAGHWAMDGTLRVTSASPVVPGTPGSSTGS